MKRTLVIDLVILAFAPVLSAIAIAAELTAGFLPFKFSWNWIARSSFAPFAWYRSVGIEALLLWIIPVIVLSLMILTASKQWRKTSFTLTLVFDLCWIAIVHLWVAMDAMGQC